MPDKTAHMLQKTLGVLGKLQSMKGEDFTEGMKEYLQLVDEFYQENEHLMARQQYKAAQTDPEYFLRLLVLAEAIHKDE